MGSAGRVGYGRPRHPPNDLSGGSGSSEGEDDAKEEFGALKGSNVKVVAADKAKLITLKVAFDVAVLEKEVQIWAGAREIARQEILRLDNEGGQARFTVPSQSKNSRCFTVTLPPNRAWEETEGHSQHVGRGGHLPLPGQEGRLVQARRRGAAGLEGC